MWQNAAVADVLSSELRDSFERERLDAKSMRATEPAALRQATVAMYGRLARLQDDAIARGNVPIACRRGCSYCCHLRVEIRPHEAFVLAHHIATRFSAEQRARAEARIDATAQRIAAMTVEEHQHAGIPCALLEDGVCTAYEGRPAACRKYYSVSLTTCRDAYNDPAAPLTGPLDDDDVRLAGNAVALGFAKGREDAGFDAKLYELHFALAHALRGSQAERRYRAGKKAFV
jgi:hypothetical protein